MSEIKKLVRQTRKLLIMHGAFDPRADINRLYVPRREGEGGMLNVEIRHTITIERLKNYLRLKKEDKYLAMVYRQTQNQTEIYDQNKTSITDQRTQLPTNLKPKL